MTRDAGEHRSWLPLVTATLFVLLTAGCAQISSPSYDTSSLNCRTASDAMLASASSKLTVPGTLRNGKVVEGDQGRQFLSAELHRPDDDKHAKGDLLTFAFEQGEDSLTAVDAKARDDTTWPDAPFDVRADGARQSRRCADLFRGKTKAQIECEQQSGGAIPLPANRDCGDL